MVGDTMDREDVKMIRHYYIYFVNACDDILKVSFHCCIILLFDNESDGKGEGRVVDLLLSLGREDVKMPS